MLLRDFDDIFLDIPGIILHIYYYVQVVSNSIYRLEIDSDSVCLGKRCTVPHGWGSCSPSL